MSKLRASSGNCPQRKQLFRYAQLQDGDGRIIPSVPVGRDGLTLREMHHIQLGHMRHTHVPGMPGCRSGRARKMEMGGLVIMRLCPCITPLPFFSQRLTRQLGQAQADRVMETLPANKRYAYGKPWVLPDVSSVLGVVGASRASKKGAHRMHKREKMAPTGRMRDGTQETCRERT